MPVRGGRFALDGAARRTVKRERGTPGDQRSVEDGGLGLRWVPSHLLPRQLPIGRNESVRPAGLSDPLSTDRIASSLGGVFSCNSDFFFASAL